jgi:hypothetical protein
MKPKVGDIVLTKTKFGNIFDKRVGKIVEIKRYHCRIEFINKLHMFENSGNIYPFNHTEYIILGKLGKLLFYE